MESFITLLHQGGRPGRWGSLGLWAQDTADYFGACTELALAVGRAAGVLPGDRVLSVACGGGEELRLWHEAFGARAVLGVDADAALVQAIADGGTGLAAKHGSGTALHALGLPEARFDRVLCVDAAYHLQPRCAFLQDAFRLLRPGGTLAYTDLVIGRARGPGPLLLRGSARLCGLPAQSLATAAEQLQQLQALGYEGATLQGLDDAVLGGFARFVRSQGRAPWHWPRVAVTAALIPPCRALGLGYATLSARRPAGTPTAASTRAATA